MKKILKNWKTTLFGIGSIFSGVVLIVKGNIPEGVTSIMTGLGLAVAKDHDNNF
jgi:hypothetical protein